MAIATWITFSMCSLLVKKKKKSCRNSSNSCTLLCHFYLTHFSLSEQSHCIQASSWELSVMYTADKSHLLCRGESMVHLQQVHQHYTAHGEEMKRKGDQTKDKLFPLPENSISTVSNSGLCEEDMFPTPPQGETGNDIGEQVRKKSSLVVWWILWFKVLWTDFPQAHGI